MKNVCFSCNGLQIVYQSEKSKSLIEKLEKNVFFCVWELIVFI